ncbi:MAG: cell division protein ZapA [Rickettsiaceae bacterium]|nr:cell division protein ZapA [Rickettsiaceae bacterium]
MTKVAITLRNKKFELECEEKDRQNVEEAAKSIVKLVKELDSNETAPLDHLLVLAAVIIQSNKSQEEIKFLDPKKYEKLETILSDIKELTDNIASI